MAEHDDNTKEKIKYELNYEEDKTETISNDVIKNDTFQVNFNCSICFQSFSEGGGIHNICTLPCGHIFGKSCLVKWFSIQAADHFCPTCKCPIIDLKIKIEDNVYNSIIPLYGLTKNTSIETVILGRKKLIDEYEIKIKELSTENIKLKEQLKNSLRLRREAFTLRSFAIDRDDDISAYERMLTELNGSDSRINNSNPLPSRRVANLAFVINRNMGESNTNTLASMVQTSRIFNLERPQRNNLTRNNQDDNASDDSNFGVVETISSPPISLLPSERGIDFMNMTLAPRYPRVSPSMSCTTTRKYRVHFDEVIDSTYNDGLIVSAVKRIVRNNNVYHFGISFFRYLRGSVYISLSDQEIVSVKVIKDPLLPNIQRVIAVCNKGRFYNLKFNEEVFGVISKFEGVIGQSQTFSGRVTLLHKPTGLTWLTPNKYAIGTKRGHIFVRTFFENTTRWLSINRYTNSYGEIHTGLKKPIMNLQSINEHAVICSQMTDVCIFDDRSGREAFYKCCGDILSLSFNKTSDTLAVILGGARNRSQIKTFKIENVNQFYEDGKNNYDISFISSTLHNDKISEKRELNSIVLRANNVDTFATFWLDEDSKQLSLISMLGCNDLMNQIELDSPRTIKVCFEDGVNLLDDSQTIHYIIVSSTNVTVYDLKMNSS
ncbi:Zinc finger, RING-type domain and Zinc finger, RING/FYVE/PHD-type domain-containing protein [Strongyloides ratti]|uniref:Zinc finger, RING-type domain and Zinc finger, RING/FYVE/PHD-type domain-containing protein n=1 Tax=Strongyloides ratti TaxID=34506 RepID=A0A090LGN2_STRRB|nr:Zinc finger, RING-type domain and Zinc finger, RING/FYVE/PHD-type domain-containing protein [Strongyloides ratti]CEF68956.1 Zinc finger, RING-type domain and Zinc finger, RING/FYVE/PHD-type domain-containing protein [Strongyloides ratti]